MARMVVDLLQPIANASKTVHCRRESVAVVLPIYFGMTFNTADVNHVRQMLETKATARSAELNGEAASAFSSEPDAGNGRSLMKFLQSINDLPEREVAEIDPNATAKAQVEVA
ncbi:hypothetical protein AAVH_37782, partial [Aphelenchoides avenae]